MVEKKNSYDSWWLKKDMENMGYIFEYCDKYCKQLFHVDIDKKKFLNAFMVSKFRLEMETGHERLLSQSAQDSVKMFINVDCYGNIEQFKREEHTSDDEFHYHQWYWIGWAYAYLHYHEDILSRELVQKLPLDTMLEHYYLGHEMDITVYHSKVKQVFEA